MFGFDLHSDTMFKRKTWHLDHEDDASGSESDTGSDTSSEVSSGSEGSSQEGKEAGAGRRTSAIGANGGGIRKSRSGASTDEERGATGASQKEQTRFACRSEVNEERLTFLVLECDVEDGEDSDGEVQDCEHGWENLKQVHSSTGRENKARDPIEGSSSEEEVDGDGGEVELRQPPPGQWTGKAFRCNVCPDVLCLSSKIMDQHLASKKHKKSLRKMQSKEGAVMQSAKGGEPEEETETHAERLQRLKEMNMKREKVKAEEEARKLERKKKKSKGGRQRQKLRAQKKKAKALDS